MITHWIPLLLLLYGGAIAAPAQSTAFTHPGRLNGTGAPAHGSSVLGAASQAALPSADSGVPASPVKVNRTVPQVEPPKAALEFSVNPSPQEIFRARYPMRQDARCQPPLQLLNRLRFQPP